MTEVFVVILGEEEQQTIWGVYATCEEAMAACPGAKRWQRSGERWYEQNRPLRIERHPVTVAGVPVRA